MIGFSIWMLVVGGVFGQCDDVPSANWEYPDTGFDGEDLSGSLQPPQRPGPPTGVYKATLTPHWFQDNARFWYRNDLKDVTKEFIVVDAEHVTRSPAFDHTKLAAGLSKAAAGNCTADRLPFRDIEFSDDGKAVRFAVDGTTWQCDLNSYECVKSDKELKPPPAEQAAPRRQRPRGPSRSDRSPDVKWTAVVKDHNLFIRPQDGGDEIQLTTDGEDNNRYAMPTWSPDSKTLAAFRVEPAKEGLVYLIESSPKAGGRATMTSRPYALPGDKFPSYELNVFDIATKKQSKPEVDRIDFGMPVVRWRKDGQHFTIEKIDRGHQRFRLIEVDARNGQARNLIDEKSPTFIWTVHTENVGLDIVNYLDESEEIIYASERDGWRHLYLIDANTGAIKNQITKGNWLVRGIDRIDEDARQIWFRASGMYPDQDPYFVHYYRIDFDGTNLTALTEGNATHTVRYSPDRKFFIDTYSRVDSAPVHELRRAADGKLICELEKADISELQSTGWEPPEVFVAKGRDGQTDIWGIICRPRNFSPTKKYPVIEQIYAGPQGSFVPKSFSAFRRFGSLTDLGFIVVQMDGMGTANRSKAFHDVCWHNLKDAGLPDRILWHKAAAAKYTYYDISRVGIYGGSAGGQNAAGAVLFHPDFYKVAVAGCGCHDNRMDKASWNEQWMGYPVGPQYAANSNIDNASRLRGKLMLIVGELDNNVPPESTLRFADALIKAGKDFDLVVVPGAGHGMGGAYGNRRMHDFFVRHLQNVDPPDRNAPAANAAPAN
jgi:dipeptidyl aminopeptidase/acylaminoacyl peptidase